MTDHPDKGKRRGTMPCENCGETVSVRVAATGMLYYNCEHRQGGCGYQAFARTRDADKNMARRIAKWDDPAQRKAYLGDEALPAKARKPAADPVPDPDPDPPNEDDAPNDAAPDHDPAPVADPPSQRRPRAKSSNKKFGAPAPNASKKSTWLW